MHDQQHALRDLFDAGTHEQIVTVAHTAARPARLVPFPTDLHGEVAEALRTRGIESLYTHQARSFELAAGRRRSLVVATGTASGKSLCFTLPVLDAAARDRNTRALFLYPTKALTQDQARGLSRLALAAPTFAIYDGDTPQGRRRLIRQKAGVVLSNPDMLHLGMLPAHERWGQFLHDLRYVVLDEAHVYRGVFGSHVALLLRRLRRLCAQYGSDPVFILTSATMAAPRAFAERLVGLPFEALEDDGAPRPERAVVLWNPPLEDPDSGQRRSPLAETAGITTEVVAAGGRAIVFAQSRRATELLADAVRRRLCEHPRAPAGAADRVLPYRAGYTPQQRREIERRLFEHGLDAVVATSALELGIDVGSLDVSLVMGFPGTVTSLLQRWGRAGREGRGWAILVAGQDALDQFFMREPDRLLGRPVEQATVDLRNPYVLDAHLQAAAYEIPLRDEDERYFGAEGLQRAAGLAAAGRLRRSAAGLAWALPQQPAADVSLRTAGRERCTIVDLHTGAVIGELEGERVFRTAHPGAVYLHLGESYAVRQLDLRDGVVFVEPFHGGYYTQPQVEKNVFVTGQSELRELGSGILLSFGTIEVTEQVIAYRKRDATDHRVVETVPLDLPETSFTTQALWTAFSAETLEQALVTGDAAAGGRSCAADGTAAGAAEPTATRVRDAAGSGTAGAAETPAEPPDDNLRIAGSLHAAEHALIAILPLYAMCDRWDIGGLSTPWHWQTDRATVFVYDAHPGGIGLARAGFDELSALVADAHTLIARCPCESGCPSCVQSPKCGNLNEPLDKHGARQLLAAMLGDPSAGDGRPDPARDVAAALTAPVVGPDDMTTARRPVETEAGIGAGTGAGMGAGTGAEEVRTESASEAGEDTAADAATDDGGGPR